MKLIFEYDEQTSKHVPNVYKNNNGDDDGNKSTKEIGSADVLTRNSKQLAQKGTATARCK